MEVQGGKDGAEKKKRTKRGRWTPAQRREIVAASYVAGASINKVAPAIWYPTEPPESMAPTRSATDRGLKAQEQAGAVCAAVRIKAMAMDGTIEIDQASGLVRVRGLVDAGMLREVLAAIR